MTSYGNEHPKQISPACLHDQENGSPSSAWQRYLSLRVVASVVAIAFCNSYLHQECIDCHVDPAIPPAGSPPLCVPLMLVF